MSIHITQEPIQNQGLPLGLKNDGAVLEFFGVVRESENGEAISAIDYETFAKMAEHQLILLRSKIITDEKISGLECIHRVGVINVGEASLFVRVIAPHRPEAFKAMMRFIDELKQMVPIWKHPIKK